jgi:hypothetical protein
MQIIRNEAKPAVREYVGRAWVNPIKTGDNAGKQMLNLRFDRGVSSIKVSPNTVLELWPNLQREGKRDAEYRVSATELSAQPIAR